MDAVLAIFVGGASSRMGGSPKGLLLVNEADVGPEAIVSRLVRLGTELGLLSVLVGAAEPYLLHWPELRVVADHPAGVGPLGGLAGVLDAAGDTKVLALACDMPYVSRALLLRFLTSLPGAPLLASRTPDGRWDPLCARYQPRSIRPLLQQALAEGVRSFQGLFARLPVTELTLTAAEREQLRDWDTPEDIAR